MSQELKKVQNSFFSLCTSDSVPCHYWPHGLVPLRRLWLSPLDALLPHLLCYHLHHPVRQLLLPDLSPPAAQTWGFLLIQSGQGSLQWELQRTQQGRQWGSSDWEQRREPPGEFWEEKEERKSQKRLETEVEVRWDLALGSRLLVLKHKRLNLRKV